jgi:hypothetical protein
MHAAEGCMVASFTFADSQVFAEAACANFMHVLAATGCLRRTRHVIPDRPAAVYASIAAVTVWSARSWLAPAKSSASVQRYDATRRSCDQARCLSSN